MLPGNGTRQQSRQQPRQHSKATLHWNLAWVVALYHCQATFKIRRPWILPLPLPWVLPWRKTPPPHLRAGVNSFCSDSGNGWQRECTCATNLCRAARVKRFYLHRCRKSDFHWDPMGIKGNRWGSRGFRRPESNSGNGFSGSKQSAGTRFCQKGMRLLTIRTLCFKTHCASCPDTRAHTNTPFAGHSGGPSGVVVPTWKPTKGLSDTWTRHKFSNISIKHVSTSDTLSFLL